MVTHCIVGEQPRENDISDAKDLYEVPAVTPYWVLLSAFCNKILPHPFIAIYFFEKYIYYIHDRIIHRNLYSFSFISCTKL